MKNNRKITQNLMKKVVESTLKHDANSTSCIIFYQPKAPASLKKFSKLNDAE